MELNATASGFVVLWCTSRHSFRIRKESAIVGEFRARLLRQARDAGHWQASISGAAGQVRERLTQLGNLGGG